MYQIALTPTHLRELLTRLQELYESDQVYSDGINTATERAAENKVSSHTRFVSFLLAGPLGGLDSQIYDFDYPCSSPSNFLDFLAAIDKLLKILEGGETDAAGAVVEKGWRGHNPNS